MQPYVAKSYAPTVIGTRILESSMRSYYIGIRQAYLDVKLYQAEQHASTKTMDHLTMHVPAQGHHALTRDWGWSTENK